MIDDFAHRPEGRGGNVKSLRQKYAVVSGSSPFLRREDGRRGWAVFQEPYARAFTYSDYAIIAGVYTLKASELARSSMSVSWSPGHRNVGKTGDELSDADADSRP